MRKLVIFLITILFITTNSFAEIYYCSDTDNTGFYMEGNKYKTTNFKLERFKAKIDFDNLKFESNIVAAPICTSNYTKSHMVCVGEYGNVILIRENLKYQRAVTFGRGDTLHIAYGRCEIF